jgi:hypothetical protein
MTDLPKYVDIHEEGPREGFQIEPGPISTADKIRLIEACRDRVAPHSGGLVREPAYRAGLGRRRGRCPPGLPRRKGSTTPRCGSTRTVLTAS